MRVQLLHAAPSLRSPTKYNRPSPTPFALSNIHCICGTDHDFDRPSGTGPFCIDIQALRAWLRSACPSGTKAIRLSKHLTIILVSAYGSKPRSEFSSMRVVRDAIAIRVCAAIEGECEEVGLRPSKCFFSATQHGYPDPWVPKSLQL